MLAVDPFVMKLLLGLYAIAVLIALAALLRWERRELARQGKAGAWRTVRLAAIPIALATAAAIIVPVRLVSGMEAMLVFYLLLLTAAPLVWIGLHWLVGRMTRPALSFADALQLAVTLPAFAVLVALIAHQLQPVAIALSRDARPAERPHVPQPPDATVVAPR